MVEVTSKSSECAVRSSRPLREGVRRWVAAWTQLHWLRIRKLLPHTNLLPLGEEIAVPLLPSLLREGSREGRLQLAISRPTMTELNTANP